MRWKFFRTLKSKSVESACKLMAINFYLVSTLAILCKYEKKDFLENHFFHKFSSVVGRFSTVILGRSGEIGSHKRLS
jgi:hypothetical protein